MCHPVHSIFSPCWKTEIINHKNETQGPEHNLPLASCHHCEEWMEVEVKNGNSILLHSLKAWWTEFSMIYLWEWLFCAQPSYLNLTKAFIRCLFWSQQICQCSNTLPDTLSHSYPLMYFMSSFYFLPCLSSMPMTNSVYLGSYSCCFLELSESKWFSHHAYWCISIISTLRRLR
jgi:hypothetical protein